MRFKLVTDEIFERGGEKFQFNIKGGDFSEFNEKRAPMLLGHDDLQVIGRWNDIKVDEDNINALAHFGRSQIAVETFQNVEDGFIDGASVSVYITDSFWKGDVYVFNRWLIDESSITPIPQLTTARKMDFNKNEKNGNNGSYKIKMNGKNLDTDQILKLKNDKMDKKIDFENKVAELNESLNATKGEFKVTLSKKDGEIEKLSKENSDMKADIDKKDKEIVKLSKDIENMNGQAKADYLANAVKDGRIPQESVEDFIELSLSKAKTIIDKMPSKSGSLSTTLNEKKNDIKLSKDKKDFDWYMANDKPGLTKLSKEQPDLYKRLEDEKYGKD